MRIVRIQSPGVVYLEPYLLDGDYSPSVFADMLRLWLRDHGDETFVLAAVEGSEVLAFIVATAEDAGGNFAFIHQAWAKPGAPPGLSERMFQRVCLWAEERGKTSIRIESRRNPAALARRWKFEEVSRIMEYRLADDLLGVPQPMPVPTETGEEHGPEQQQAKVVQHPDEGAEGNLSGAGPVFVWADGEASRSSTVPSSGGAGPDVRLDLPEDAGVRPV